MRSLTGFAWADNKRKVIMSRYDWEELLKRWRNETVTVEQAIGQLMLWGEECATQLKQLAGELARLQRQAEVNESRLAHLERRPPPAPQSDPNER
jgi:hypothetical protein